MNNRVTPGYFQAIDSKILRGRDFTEQDDEKAKKVAIVNEAFADRFWPGEDPLGKQFSFNSADSTKREIVGIVRDGKYAGLNEPQRLFVARPLSQSYAGSTTVIVRSQSDTQQMLAAVRREVMSMDPQIPLASRTLNERLEIPLLPFRVAASVLGGLGVVALALAAIGIYGVMSYSVATRTREVGIRMALGAQKSDVLRLILGGTMILMLIGVVVGLSSAVAAARLMATMLFGVNAGDPLTYAVVTLLLAIVGVLACWVPARRATKVDPMVALRYE